MLYHNICVKDVNVKYMYVSTYFYHNIAYLSGKSYLLPCSKSSFYLVYLILESLIYIHLIPNYFTSV